MTKLRVLWLSNKVQAVQDRGSTGTWLDAMAQALVQSGKVELANVAMGLVSHTTRQDAGGIVQWVIPAMPQEKLRNGLPPASVIGEICRIAAEFAPDVIHIWGTENFWGLLSARHLLPQRTLLETQGIKGAIARVYAGGLSWHEQIACIGIKEILRGTTIMQVRQSFAAWAPFEREIIAGHRFITVQSRWQEAQVRVVNASCTISQNDLPLRTPFYAAESWQPTGEPVIFCSASYPSPFKGIHIAVRTLATLKHSFPMIQLRIAGALHRPGLRQEGYMAWINREVKRLDVADNVQWLGPISAEKIVVEMQQCAAVFLPSFIESYSMALVEAMAVGAPTVVAYIGGAAHLAHDEDSALYFSPGDVEMAAYQISRLLSDPEFARHLSTTARSLALMRNDPAQIVRRQLDIYNVVCNATMGTEPAA